MWSDRVSLHVFDEYILSSLISYRTTMPYISCEKTTQLPQILMDRLSSSQVENSSFGSGRILCTQPRRISATSVAERVCYERNEKIGNRVGYQIRFEHKASDTTELLYCTTGILLRFLVSNPKLEGVSCVIIDEVHERSVHNDFVLLILKDLVLERKGSEEPLKLVLMSATLDASNFIKYFDPNSEIKFNNMAARKSDQLVDEEGNESTSTSPFSVSFLQLKGKTNYPIEEYFIEDLCQEIPSLVISPPASKGRVGKNGLMPEPRNPWASPRTVMDRYHELGLKSNNTTDWKALSNVLQRTFQ